MSSKISHVCISYQVFRSFRKLRIYVNICIGDGFGNDDAVGLGLPFALTPTSPPLGGTYINVSFSNVHRRAPTIPPDRMQFRKLCRYTKVMVPGIQQISLEFCEFQCELYGFQRLTDATGQYIFRRYWSDYIYSWII